MSYARSDSTALAPTTFSREPIQLGEVLEEKYAIERLIGDGGMAVVYAAKHLALDEKVAVKLLRPEVLDDDEVVSRFAREAKTTVRIRSEYAVKLLDVGVSARRGPYIVMELLDGDDLRTVLDRKWRLPVRTAVEFALQVCEALAVAHANDIVHRDLKPENLFVARHGDMQVIKVLDFGISKASITGSILNRDVSRFNTTSLAGSPAYMSPEQFSGSTQTDSRSDIWSLGVVMCEMMSGKLPFYADNVSELRALVLESAPSPGLMADVPPELGAIVARCLDKDPAQRFQNVGELAVALMAFGPTRARVCAERAVSALRAVGQDIRARFDSIVPGAYQSLPPVIVTDPAAHPMASPGQASGEASAVAPAQSAVPPPDPVITTSTETVEDSDASEVVAEHGDDLSGTPVRAHRRRAVILTVGAACLLGLTVWYLWQGDLNQRVASGAVAPVSGSSEVWIESIPAGMLVEWNGRAVGATPLRASLPAGTQTVELSGNGFDRKRVQFEASSHASEQNPLRVTMDLAHPAQVLSASVPTADAQTDPRRQTAPVRGKGLERANPVAPRDTNPPGPAGSQPPDKPQSIPTTTAEASKRPKLLDDVNRVPIVE